MSDRLEGLAKAMHETWLEVMAEQGFHPHGGHYYSTDECEKCRNGLVPWEEVPEEVKEVNRRGVKAICEYFFGRDTGGDDGGGLQSLLVPAEGEVVVPKRGAVGKVREALDRLIDCAANGEALTPEGLRELVAAARAERAQGEGRVVEVQPTRCRPELVEQDEPNNPGRVLAVLTTAGTEFFGGPGRINLTITRLPKLEPKKVRPWKTKLGTFLCGLCHQVLWRSRSPLSCSCGMDIDWNHPRELPE